MKRYVCVVELYVLTSVMMAHSAVSYGGKRERKLYVVTIRE